MKAIVSKKSRPALVLALGALAAVGVLLYAYKASASPALPAPGPMPSGGGGGGTSGDYVSQTSGGKLTTAQAQSMMKALGPAAGSSAMASLAVDGAWGPKTQAAVKSFQSIKGIRVDGIVGPQTADTLATTYQKFTASGGASV